MALANSHNVVGDQDAAITAIDKAIALLEPGDKRLETCKSMRGTFQKNLLNRQDVKKPLER
jgi:hypothetical protein